MRKPILFVMVCLLILSISIPLVSAGSLKSIVVSDAYGLSNYTLRTNTIFQPGDTINVYTQFNDVNHDGFIFADFVFIIKDPKDNFVAMSQEGIEYRGYTEDTYVLYAYVIPDFWVDGKYKMEIYAYDRANVSKIRSLEERAERTDPEDLLDDGDFGDLKTFFETGGNANGMGAVKSYSGSKTYRTYTSFVVEREVIEKQEADDVNETILPKKQMPNFVVNRLDTDKFKVAPNESILISAEVENTGAGGTKTIEIYINGKKETEKPVTLARKESKIIQFQTKKELPGTYKITIPDQNVVKLFFVIEPSSESSNLIVAPPKEEKSKFNFSYVGIMIEMVIAIMIWNHYRKRGKKSIGLDPDCMPDTDVDDKSPTQSDHTWFTQLTEDQQNQWDRPDH